MRKNSALSLTESKNCGVRFFVHHFLASGESGDRRTRTFFQEKLGTERSMRFTGLSA